MKKKWQKALCLLAVMVIGLSCIMPVFASDREYPDIPVVDGMDFYVIYSYPSGESYLFLSSAPQVLVFDSLGSSGSRLNGKQYKLNGNSWIYTEPDFAGGILFSFDYNLFDYANYDVCSSDGTVYFKKKQLPEHPILEEVQQSQLIPTIAEALSLIPLLVPLIVGFLGFRKAWSMLSNQLRGA